MMLWNIGFFIVAIVILVSFHEWGHYLFARLFKVKIITFSVGFGQTIFSWRNKKDTQFVVAVVPLGGFVRMAGSQEKDELDQPIKLNADEVYYDKLPPLKRIIISLAGPLFNFILAYLIYVWVFTHPITQQNLVFDEVLVQSVAYESGLTDGAEIIKVNGRSFNNLRELRLYLYRFAGQSRSVPIEYKQNGELKYTQFNLENLTINPTFGVYLQLGLIQKEENYQASVVTVSEGPAKIAGMLDGDIWYSINDELIDSQSKWILGIQSGGIQNWQVLRDGQLIALELIPTRDESIKDSPYSIGVKVQSSAKTRHHLFKQDFTALESIVYSFGYTLNMIEFNIISIIKLIKGEFAVKNLGGPGTMADASGSAAKSGLLSFLALLGVLSISLGVINLMPIPMLDGGNVLIDSIELIRKKALSESWQLRFRTVGLLIVLSVMALAITNDLFRYL
ncbi:MAG: RIP metalloprotease RseP [Saccharospirillaceae bacterium]|nr:RIP metalloprotease RseP [Pseudomonadales bacterium]NRB78603.1 RIP metalloprotease RseP [Saccharospirillaceae bacterium]